MKDKALHQRTATASRGGSASPGCGALLAALLLGCAGPDVSPPDEPVFRVHTAARPSPEERYCAWYGAADDGVLYFGQSAFWSAMRAAGGDPRADLARPGPRTIGRFDLATRQFLDPIATASRGRSETRSGVWDVLPLGGRIYFTTYFEEAGFVDLESGEVRLIPNSRFWNELAPGPVAQRTQGFSTAAETLILATRYADAGMGGGAIVILDPDGKVVAEHHIEAPAGVAFAPKTPAWDPIRQEIWVTTDRLPLPARGDLDAPFAHPTLVFSALGVEVARFGSEEDPAEIQFVKFNSQGMGFVALRRGPRLELLILAPNTDRRDLHAAPRVVLDASFPGALDFAQDIQIGPSGNVFVTRWSGRVHEVNPVNRSVRSWTFPRDGDELYYTAVPGGTDGSVCATRCGEVEIVCASLDAAGKRSPAAVLTRSPVAVLTR